MIFLSTLKTIFVWLRSDQYVSQTQGPFPTSKSLTSTSLPRRTDRTKVFTTSVLIRFKIAMKSLCHGLATPPPPPQQPSCKGVASLMHSYSYCPATHVRIYTVAVHSHRDSFPIVAYSQTVFADQQKLAGVCINFAQRSLKVATTLVRDCQKVVNDP